MKKISLFFILCIAAFTVKAQLFINNATFQIQTGATVIVQGDVTSNVDILGPGKVLLGGSANQNITMNGFTIPNLEINNAANATLLTNARIGSSMLFTNGKIIQGNFDMKIADVATITGGAAGKYFQISGTGQLIKELSANATAYELPVGEGTNYRPAYLTSSGTYTAAQFGVRVLAGSDANKPPMIASYLNTNWPVTKSGITGTASLSGQYIDPTDVSGTESNLVGYFKSGTDWSSIGETHNAATNQVGALVTAATGVVSGLNKFLAVGTRAFLQGSYVAGTGLMTDALRTLPFGPASSNANFPQDDPYRQALYSAAFPHVNNVAIETIPNAAVLDQAGTNDDIVDWVFLQLRNLAASPGNTIQQTRSALIQRDGDIVDIDGVSPVTFNGLAGLVDGNYIITVRHRNHLGLSYVQSAPKPLTESSSLAFTPAKVFDLRTEAQGNLFGLAAAHTTLAHPTLGNGTPNTVNVLWGGNANFNGNVRFSALSNDRDFILVTTLSNNPLTVISPIYSPADVNMNKVVRWSALNNDRDFLLINALGNNPLNVRTQAIPN